MAWRGFGILAMAAVPACFSTTTAEDPLEGPVQQAGVYALSEDERAVRVSVLLHGELDEVFPWFSRPDLLEKWLADEVEIATEPGGPFVLRWRIEPEVDGEAERTVEIPGRVLVSDPPRRMEFEIEALGDVKADRLLLWAEEDAGGVRVFLEQLPFTGGMQGEDQADLRRRTWFEALKILRAAYERDLPTTPVRPPTGLDQP